ncbi:MAG: hypothetical protein COV75_07775 [Candidatus Omnitrophica bacterium CG11_big_fil_rev_8_21_14_0_20_63_9]|nr:MAG: hypothetical protein COV75_07775 [Candidatus Omnitrophica bacterium CG11_big_fil_rev_8_21_14_0_20_63_9]
MARVLVTGGAGFIGAAMAEHLRRTFPELMVRVLDLHPCPVQGVDSRVGSILDISHVSAALRGCDYVIHLAALLGVKRTDSQPMKCLHINVQGTLNVLEECVKNGVKKIVFASSSEVYGEQATQPISESSPLNPRSVYAVSKLTGEEYVRAYHQRYGLNYTIMRPFNVYGPRQVAEFVVPRFIKAVLSNKPPTIYDSGRQVRAFCYVDDAMHGIALALFTEGANGEVLNIGNPQEPISVRDLAYKVIALGHKQLEPVLVPFEQAGRSLERDREIFARIPDISKATRLIGYAPTVSLTEGLSRIMQHGQIEETRWEPLEWQAEHVPS